jgi:peptide/nickel transport system ATP-binding protein
MTANPSSAPVLEIKNLTVEYVANNQRLPAVSNLSLTVRPGEIYGLVGESGCGKSTAALACVRYLPPKTRLQGQINLIGEDILTINSKRLRELRGNRVAMVYQDPLAALNPSMSIMAQMQEILVEHERISSASARKRCMDLLEKVRIADPQDVAGRYPHQLSGGMQQRVLIAMALLLHPSLLIMDEPTTGLDVTIESAVLDLVNELRQEFNTAILFISHNLGVVARLCDRVGVMYAGQMVEEAPVLDLFKNPQHPYTLGLLRCIPRKGSRKAANALWSIPGHVPALYELPDHCYFASRCPAVREECKHTHPPIVDTSPVRRSRCLYWDQLGSLQNQPADEAESAPLLDSTREQGSEGLSISDLKIHFKVTGGILALSPATKTVKAVDGISFQLPPGKTVGIVGESGCGKSTLARAVAGLTPVAHGTMRLNGGDLNLPVNRRDRKVLRALQMVFQNPDSTLNPQKTVGEELARPLRLFNLVSKKEEKAAVEKLLAAVNLSPAYRERYPQQLSGGEKQRVAIARAFAGSPSLVLCDEPTSSLDVSVQSMVLNLLQRLQRETDVSLLFISHDLGVVRYISDYIGVVYLGKLCEFGTTQQIFEPPYHPYTEALLSAIPVPDPTVHRQRINLEGNIPSSITPPVGCRFHTRCPRKIGPICENVPPPEQALGEHILNCHIPAAELLTQQANLG